MRRIAGVSGVIAVCLIFLAPLTVYADVVVESGLSGFGRSWITSIVLIIVLVAVVVVGTIILIRALWKRKERERK